MAATAPAQVVLTREQGKNDALRKVLEARGISCLELPMVETAAGPDQARLPQVA
jgi:uroporphyrinogen-III synthase